MKLTIFRVLDGIYQKIDTIDFFMWKRNGSLFLLLSGIEVDPSPGDFKLFPAYIPFLCYEARAGQFVLDLHFWTDKVYRFIFQARYPFVNYTKIEETEYTDGDA